MEKTVNDVLNQVQTFSQAAIHGRTNDSAPHGCRYFLLSKENDQPMAFLGEALKQRIEAVSAPSNVYRFSEITQETLRPHPEVCTDYHVVCKATDTGAMERFLEQFNQVLRIECDSSGISASQMVKLNLFLLFTADDTSNFDNERKYRGARCRPIAQSYCRLFHETFDPGELDALLKMNYFPSCNVIFMRLKEMQSNELLSLAGELLYFQISPHDDIMGYKASYDDFTSDDYKWKYFTVLDSHFAERIVLTELSNELRNFISASPDTFGNSLHRIAKKIRDNFLGKMELDDLGALQDLLQKCTWYVPVQTTKTVWDGEDTMKQAGTASAAAPRVGLLGSLFSRKKARQTETQAEQPRELWNTDDAKLENSYQEYLNTVVNAQAFFDMLFSELTCMVSPDSNDAVYASIKGELIKVISEVFSGENLPKIWENTASGYIAALTVDEVKSRCKAVQSSCTNLIKAIEELGDRWAATVARPQQAGEFNDFVKKHFKLHAGDSNSICEQVIDLLRDFQGNQEALDAFCADYKQAVNGISNEVIRNPSNPLLVDSVIPPQECQMNQKDFSSYRLYCWSVSSLQYMKN